MNVEAAVSEVEVANMEGQIISVNSGRIVRVDGVMFHIILTSETLLTNQHPLRYTATSVSVTAANFAVNAATAVYVTAVFNAAAAFTIIATAFTVIATAFTIIASVYVTTAVFTATTTISLSSASASDRSLHSVNRVRPWSYHPPAPFPQSVMSI
jgi:hypothetical protein